MQKFMVEYKTAGSNLVSRIAVDGGSLSAARKRFHQFYYKCKIVSCTQIVRQNKMEE